MYLLLLITEINSTNSLCLHVTAFANGSGNKIIAIVTSAISPETENSSSYWWVMCLLGLFCPFFLSFYSIISAGH